MNLSFLSRTSLFQGCSEKDIRRITEQWNLRPLSYKKDAVIYEEGTIITQIGLVLSGSVRIGFYDFRGNQNILDIAYTGDIFAEAYACIPEEPLMIHVTANEPCEILFIRVPELFNSQNRSDTQNRLLRNLMTICAQKNLQLSRRSLHTSPKTIRERLLSYFSFLIREQGSHKIATPFNRQQLADYLNLDRSALSKELGRMKKEGLLDYHKNIFELKIQNEPGEKPAD
ncbi:MAG: Crp/Fnr family transcriptional regulator [Lachnospiraceae bacterium]|nr:Crp/Fnr family transcriptional regulator [Lachnospiraceae bacterium]